MPPETRTIRCLLAFALSLSVCVATVSPLIIAAQSADGLAVASATAPQKCCCGTVDGRCCGTGCCSANAPKPDPSPQGPRPAERDYGPLTLLAASSSAVIDGLESGHCHAAHGFSLESEPAQSTLLAQHVLLQT